MHNTTVYNTRHHHQHYLEFLASCVNPFFPSPTSLQAMALKFLFAVVAAMALMVARATAVESKEMGQARAMAISQAMARKDRAPGLEAYLMMQGERQADSLKKFLVSRRKECGCGTGTYQDTTCTCCCSCTCVHTDPKTGERTFSRFG